MVARAPGQWKEPFSSVHNDLSAHPNRTNTNTNTTHIYNNNESKTSRQIDRLWNRTLVRGLATHTQQHVCGQSDAYESGSFKSRSKHKANECLLVNWNKVDIFLLHWRTKKTTAKRAESEWCDIQCDANIRLARRHDVLCGVKVIWGGVWHFISRLEQLASQKKGAQGKGKEKCTRRKQTSQNRNKKKHQANSIDSQSAADTPRWHNRGEFRPKKCEHHNYSSLTVIRFSCVCVCIIYDDNTNWMCSLQSSLVSSLSFTASWLGSWIHNNKKTTTVDDR